MGQQGEPSHTADEAPRLDASETTARVEALMARARGPQVMSAEERQEALDEIITLHAALAPQDEKSAEMAEVAFLLLLRDDPEILDDPNYRQFVAGCLDQSSIKRMRWESVEEVIRVAEVLYGFRYQDDLTADQITEHVQDLVRHALRQFEGDHEPEQMLELLRRAPIPIGLMDAELIRLRNQLHLYEMRRVRHKERWLYAFLLLQLLFVLVIAPVLLKNSENGQLQRQVEETIGLQVVDDEIICEQTEDGAECEIPRQFLSFRDSLYWSIITYTTIGYGDISPVTSVGKLLAAIHGIMGVLTTGVIAGLILNWLSPRTPQV